MTVNQFHQFLGCKQDKQAEMYGVSISQFPTQPSPLIEAQSKTALTEVAQECSSIRFSTSTASKAHKRGLRPDNSD